MFSHKHHKYQTLRQRIKLAIVPSDLCFSLVNLRIEIVPLSVVMYQIHLYVKISASASVDLYLEYYCSDSRGSSKLVFLYGD